MPAPLCLRCGNLANRSYLFLWGYSPPKKASGLGDPPAHADTLEIRSYGWCGIWKGTASIAATRTRNSFFLSEVAIVALFRDPPTALAVYRAEISSACFLYHRLDVLQKHLRLVDLRNEAGVFADNLSATGGPRHALFDEPGALQAQDHLIEEALEPRQLEPVLG